MIPSRAKLVEEDEESGPFQTIQDGGQPGGAVAAWRVWAATASCYDGKESFQPVLQDKIREKAGIETIPNLLVLNVHKVECSFSF